MRGKVAKELRGIAKDKDGKVDRTEYKRIKKLYKAKLGHRPSLGHRIGKFPKARKSKWKNARIPGIHALRVRPQGHLEFIGDIFADLDAHGKLAALNLVKAAERLDKPALARAIQHFKDTHVNK